MNGPEHYREAERRLAEAATQIPGSTYEDRELRYAQLHAALALSAAQFDRNLAKGSGASVPEFHDWAEVPW